MEYCYRKESEASKLLAKEKKVLFQARLFSLRGKSSVHIKHITSSSFGGWSEPM